ncbi:flagellar assembly protein FliW [Aneurinibacillus aneurinilyticus]|jgi:flagellar assembly factor FliW|uniref:flagellar assembly protein FliW n=1 Tax=Aneurinibacillus aneurinilyticus TaxID=1391 RepID=UPI003523E28E
MTVKMKSSLFGEIEYDVADVYTFEQGFPGFPEQKQFVLLQVEESPFTVMHSIQEDLHFFLIDPFSLFVNYEFAIPDYALEQLDIKKREDVISYSVAVLREPLTDSTVNMVAPVIFNTANRKAMQLVLENTRYSVRQPIFLPQEQAGDSRENADAHRAKSGISKGGR